MVGTVLRCVDEFFLYDLAISENIVISAVTVILDFDLRLEAGSRFWVAACSVASADDSGAVFSA